MPMLKCRLTSSFLAAGALASAMFIAAKPAHAALELQLSEAGYATQTLTDSGASPLTYASSYGTFGLSVDVGALENTVTPTIDLSSFDLSSAVAGTLTLSLTLTDVASPLGLLSFTNSIGGTLNNATGSYQTYLDNTDGAFGTTTLLSSSTLTPTSGTAFSSAGGTTASVTGNASGLYSITEMVTITTGGLSTSSFDAEMAVPEPASMAILGAGLVCLGLLRRRRPT